MSHGKISDLTGQRFGKMLVVGPALRPEGNCRKGRFWICQCDCGGTVVKESGRLPRATSCSYVCASTRSGYSYHPMYARWKSMMDRCYKDSNVSYLYYGGRGISVCDRWHDIAAFIEDVGEPPSSEHSLDRVNVDGHYAPDNVRWSTWSEQNKNQRPKDLWRSRALDLGWSEW